MPCGSRNLMWEYGQASLLLIRLEILPTRFNPVFWSRDSDPSLRGLNQVSAPLSASQAVYNMSWTDVVTRDHGWLHLVRGLCFLRKPRAGKTHLMNLMWVSREGATSCM